MELLDARGNVRGIYEQTVQLVENVAFAISDPPWTDVPLASVADPSVPAAAPPQIARITLTGKPNDLIYDSKRGRVYLSNSVSNRIEVYDPATAQLLAPIPVGSNPNGIDLSPDGDRLLVCLLGASQIAVVNLNAPRPRSRP